ncbi:FMN-dependent NADH-azoreductase [Rhizobium skierniewicense]|uniref:FMN dependent NADH:quinone oxidoreductase n=1 Tax=Rhizobium skierniewicense TaxID=984260 RepID=A0A7W6C719_9HYPH|nr:FMN-dependent NADH-azoreductase [Rhizobium skierniewicense]MBB3945866.1 FMN-dependent NADH-azoreductase [Rhizobium skierniewicense]NTF32279.1 FMN-dependent NADH-azoreductase [Rhizobium skierniewicense]
MSKILLITSSPRADESLSNKFAGDLAAKLQEQTNGTITHLDLGQNPIKHLDTVTTAAIRKAPADRNAEEAEAARNSEERVAELLEADTIVIGTGLINFNIYSGLKAWIDVVARAGLTFTYTESGPVGLATGKKVYIVLASAGVYSEGPAAPLEHAVPYLKTVLGFMGMTDVEVVRIEGLAFGPEAAEKALAAASAKVEELAKAA